MKSNPILLVKVKGTDKCKGSTSQGVVSSLIRMSHNAGPNDHDCGFMLQRGLPVTAFDKPVARILFEWISQCVLFVELMSVARASIARTTTDALRKMQYGSSVVSGYI